MFFTLSKIFWGLAQPSLLIALALVAGLALLLIGWKRSGGLLASLGIASYVAIGVFSAGQLLMAPLENRFAYDPEIADAPDGILLLTGPIDTQLSRARGELALSDGAERYVAFVELMRRYPEARGIITGGNASLTRESEGEAFYGRKLLQKLGFDVGRVTFETKARNTYENVLLSREIAGKDDPGRWVVVTSAFHMPRAIAVMRAQGWDAIPYPVDFRTEGERGRFFFTMGAGEALELTDLAAKEWLGLAAYYLAGRTDRLFPARARSAKRRTIWLLARPPRGRLDRAIPFNPARG